MKMYSCKNKKGFTHTPKFGVTPKGGGFTLVETLVAISIFTMAILAMFAVFAKGISNTNYAKRKVIAEYLAQEGIEYIRNMRDTYELKNSTTGFLDFYNKLTNNSPTSCQSDGGCYFTEVIDLATKFKVFFNCSSSSPFTCSNAPLLYNSDTGKYVYTLDINTTNSGFYRKIKINLISSNSDIQIFSTVFWTQGSGTYSVTFSENLFNWVE